MKDTAWQSSAQTGNMTPKIDGSHAACKELLKSGEDIY